VLSEPSSRGEMVAGLARHLDPVHLQWICTVRKSPRTEKPESGDEKRVFGPKNRALEPKTLAENCSKWAVFPPPCGVSGTRGWFFRPANTLRRPGERHRFPHRPPIESTPAACAYMTFDASVRRHRRARRLADASVDPIAPGKLGRGGWDVDNIPCWCSEKEGGQPADPVGDGLAESVSGLVSYFALRISARTFWRVAVGRDSQRTTTSARSLEDLGKVWAASGGTGRKP
jgi:hypothetical protein